MRPLSVCLTLVYCDQTVGWIKMPLGMKIGLGPCHTVLVGDPAPSPQKVAQHPLPHSGHFRPMSVVAKRMDQHAIWYRGRPSPHCVG